MRKEKSLFNIQIQRLILLGLIAIVLSTALVFTAGGTATSTAHAATTCSGTSCDGLSPYTYSCVNTAVNKGSETSADLGGGLTETVTLYFSYGCSTAWATVKFNRSMTSFHYGDAEIYRFTDAKAYKCENSGGNGIIAPSQTSCYTPMLYDGDGYTAMGMALFWTNSQWETEALSPTY